jgi:hypothetical protein
MPCGDQLIRHWKLLQRLGQSNGLTIAAAARDLGGRERRRYSGRRGERLH